MQMTFKVTVIIKPIEKQDKLEFQKVDGHDMKKYLKEKLEDAMKGAWQYNAKVSAAIVTVIKQ